MSLADKIFIQNCQDILENGFWDTELEVRPKWEDGAPAHTVKKFAIINRYDLQAEFPILTIRKTNFEAVIDEILWIWQKKSNNIKDLNSKIWDSWADENGSIGKAYGYQLAQKHKYKEGEFDQVDRILFDLKNNRGSRRIIANMYNHSDLHAMNLYPCAYSLTLNVTGNTLNAIPINASRYGCGQQLECGSVQRACHDVRQSFGACSRRACACDSRRPYI